MWVYLIITGSTKKCLKWGEGLTNYKVGGTISCSVWVWCDENYWNKYSIRKVKNIFNCIYLIFIASVANPPQQQQPGPVGANSQRGYSAAALAASNGPSVTSTYPQSIDLSTLLQKPTTQSSVGSSAAPGAQFNQQATETLKAVVGIGQTSSNTSAAPGSQVAQQQPNPQQDNSSALYSYAAQASAFSSIKSQSQGRQPPQSKGN